MRALASFTAAALFAACAAQQPRASTTGSSVAAVPTPTIRGTAAAWRYALPPRWDISQVRIGDTAVVIGGRSGVRVLEPASGRLRWQREGAASAIVLGDTAVYGGVTGTVASRTLSGGRVLWERRAVCPRAANPAQGGGVALIVRNANDLIVGCYGGRVVRMSVASGRMFADSGSAFVAQSIADIQPLGRCAYGVSGWSSGATLREHAAILDCKRLSVIVPEQDEMQIVGAIGNIAVLDQRCCNGRPDEYRPATIARANLTNGALSLEVDLKPEPDRYPADHRPIGQGSAVLLGGTELYLVVDRTLYRYGDARALWASPQRIAAELVDFPTFLGHGLLALRLRVQGGAIDDEIVRLRNGTLEPLWSSRESRPVDFSYDGGAAPDVLSIRYTDGPSGRAFVRTYDGARMFVGDPCQMAGANRDMIVMICTTDTLVDNRNLQYVAAYRWRDAQ